MAGPLTPFELSGGENWTTREEGLVFMQQIASETSAVYDVPGLSFEGRDIARLTIGTGPRRIVVISGVHGQERASREATLIECRKFAYEPDAVRQAILSNFTIMFVPTVNIDRFNQSRNNAQGLDINRDNMALVTPEARVVAGILAEHRPVIAVDAHETGGDGTDLYAYPFKGPNAHSAINAASEQLYDATRASVALDGYTSALYGQRPLTWFNGTSAMRNAIGILLETVLVHPPLHRVAVHSSSFDGIFEWCDANLGFIDSSIAAAKTGLSSGSYYSTFVLQQGDSDNSNGPLLSPVPSAYRLTPEQASEAEYHFSAFNIATQTEGEWVTVSMAQESAAMIPYLVDAQSLQKVVTGGGERIYAPPTPGAGKLRATRAGWVVSPSLRPKQGVWS